MLYVALAEAVVLGIAFISFASIARWSIRQQARERELLVNQVCSLAGRPWQEPPAWHSTPELGPDPLEEAWTTPEQMVA
jgi:hypothetical protein